jgi:serine/threonine protein kinase
MVYEDLLKRYVFLDKSFGVNELQQILNLEGNLSVCAEDIFLDRQVILHFFSPSKRQFFERIEQLSIPYLQTLYTHFELKGHLSPSRDISIAVLEKPTIGNFEDFIKTFPLKETLFDVIRSLLRSVVVLENMDFPLKALSSTSILVTKPEESTRLIAKISLESLWNYHKAITPEATAGGRLRSNVAPELLINTTYSIHNPISWSVGALLFELFTGEHPLENPKKFELNAAFDQLLERIPKPLNTIVEHMLLLNPKQRWDCSQALQQLSP